VGSYGVDREHQVQAGLATSALLDVSLFDTRMNFAAGVESRILQRVDDEGTHWGDWRVQALLGATQMSHPHESFLGYELFLAPGVARYHLEHQPKVGFALGVLAGLPLRLSAARPTWRSDELVGLQTYLVPSFGTNWLGFERFELNAGVALRFHLWTAIAP
jgi:hypothetical protein